MEPTCIGCCVRRITWNELASGTHIHTQTHHNKPMKMKNIKSFVISIIKQQKREFQIIDFAVSSDQRAGNFEK